MTLNNRQVEVEVDHNADGYRYILSAYFLDTGEELNDDQIEQLQNDYDDSLQLNGLWG